MRLGELARELRFTRTLIVSDKNLLRTGLVHRAAAFLDAAGIKSWGFHDFGPNPDTLDPITHKVAAGNNWYAVSDGLGVPLRKYKPEK